MAAILQGIQGALTSVPHESPRVTKRQKVLLAISGVTADMPDHKTGFFWGELLHPYECFTNAGYDVDIVSESGSATPDELSVGKMASGGDKAKFEDKAYHLHRKLAQIRRPEGIAMPGQYAGIFFAGGHSCCVDFPKAEGLKKLAVQIYEQGGVIGAVCHGPAIFEGMRLSDGSSVLQGKRATGFSTKAEEQMKCLSWMRFHGYKTMEEVVRTNGGEWSEHEKDPMADYTQVDARVITGMNPASAKSVAEHMLKFFPPETELEKREHCQDPQCVARKGCIGHAKRTELGTGLQKPDRGIGATEAMTKEQQRQYAGERV